MSGPYHTSACPDLRMYQQIRGNIQKNHYPEKVASHHEWLGAGIMAKELVPIIFTCVTWRPMLHHRHIEFQYDNKGFVAAISKGSSKDTIVMHLLRSVWFSSHTWTSPLQLHTYQVWWTQFLLWKVFKRNQPASPTQPCLCSQLTYHSWSSILSPARSRLGFPSIPTAVPRNLIITSPDISTLLTQQYEYLLISHPKHLWCKKGAAK